MAAVEKVLDESLTVIQNKQSGQEGDYDSQNNTLEEVNKLVPDVKESVDKFYQSWDAFRNRVPDIE